MPASDHGTQFFYRPDALPAAQPTALKHKALHWKHIFWFYYVNDIGNAEWWDAGVVMCLGQCADLHVAQLMPLPITISCSSKSRLVLPSWFCLSGAGLPRYWQVVPDKISWYHHSGFHMSKIVNTYKKLIKYSSIFCKLRQQLPDWMLTDILDGVYVPQGEGVDFSVVCPH